MAIHILYTKGDLWGGFPVLIPIEIITINKEARDKEARDKEARYDKKQFDDNTHNNERNESVVRWCVGPIDDTERIVDAARIVEAARIKTERIVEEASSFLNHKAIPFIMPKQRTFVYITTPYGLKKSVKYV